MEESLVDHELEKPWYQDFERLVRSQKDLLLKVKDPKLTVILRGRIASMAGTLNLYLHKTLLYTWRQASELASTAQGKGTSYARRVRTWINMYLDEKKLPKDNYGTTNNSLLADEDFAQSIQLYLLETSKGGLYFSKRCCCICGNGGNAGKDQEVEWKWCKSYSFNENCSLVVGCVELEVWKEEKRDVH